MKKLIGLLLAVCALTLATAQTITEGMRHSFWGTQTWVTKPIGWQYHPAGGAAGKPVLVWFPGRGEAPTLAGIKASTVPAQIIAGWRPSFSVVSFTGNGSGVYEGLGGSSYSSDSAYFSRIHQYLKDTLRANMSRVYLAGYSGGGAACFNWITLGPEFARQIAAILPASPMQGLWEQRALASFQASGRLIKSWGMAGTGTGDISFYNRLVKFTDLINATGGSARADAVAGAGHGGAAWNPLYSRNSAAWAWMLQQQSAESTRYLVAEWRVKFWSDGARDTTIVFQ